MEGISWVISGVEFFGGLINNELNRFSRKVNSISLQSGRDEM